jgi:hypothetical protein
VELRDAIEQISEIRAQIDRTETFRGYRSLTVGFSGLVAFLAAAFQRLFIPEPQQHVSSYLALWLFAATVSLAAAAFEMTWRSRRAASGLSARLTWMAVEQFLPCVLAGGLVTFVVVRFAESSLWMLPGLWSILFSLGVFASARLLPRPVFCVASYYMVAGAFCLAFARDEAAFSPWAMVFTFGIGQLMAAAVLYCTLERRHGQER